MTNLNDDMKKIALASIGAASVLAEKAQEKMEEYAKRGEETIAQGRALNEQLKHNVQQSVQEAMRDSVTVVETKLDKDAVLGALDSLSPEELNAIREKLAQMKPETDQING